MTDRPIVLVTGAAGDIGRATATVLAQRGWSVALTDHERAGDELDRSVDSCAAAGAGVWSTTVDVTDEQAVAAAIEQCVGDFGSPTGLFNNAGAQGPFERIDRYPIGEARSVIDVNLVGTLTVLSSVSAAMVAARNGGSVVCTASMAGVSGAPHMSVYSATKAGVIGLAKSAAKDLAPFGIRVNAVSPAFIGPGRMWDRQVELQAKADSPYYADEPDAVAAQMLAMIPLRRYGSTVEVANVVAFLLSDDASYLTGINVEIAGGST